MHNPVVYAAAHGLADADYETLRINFRGVGESTGRYDDGRGELDDATTALDALLAERTDEPREILVAGYSFGAATALRLAHRDPRITRVVAIATPVAMLDADVLVSSGRPRLFVHGESDDLAPLAQLRERLTQSAADELVVLPTDHFFGGETDDLRDRVRDWAKR